MKLQIFNSAQFGDVRMSTNENGEPLFCATDVARDLGYAKPQDAILKHCKSAGVAIRGVGVQTGVKADGTPAIQNVQMKFITEGNLYRLIARSNLPEAEKFESWIFDEVVPQVRKTGGYIPVSTEDTEQEILAKAVLISNKTIEHQKQRIQMLEGKNALLEQENKELAPKAQYTDQVLQAKETYTHSEMAKELNFRSWVAFIEACKKDHILFKQSGIYML